MELFQELIFTVALSLLASFVLAKLLSMVSTCDVADDKSVSVSVSSTDVIEEVVMCEQKCKEESVCCDFQREAAKVKELEEEEFRVETIGSPVICDDNEICDNQDVFGFQERFKEECVCKGEFDLGELKEEKVSVGGDEFEEKLVDESSERTKFGGIGIESEKLVEESPERAKFREIEIELVKDEACVTKREEAGVLESDGNKGNESNGVNSNADDDGEEGLFDDWEGIERTELEKRFGAAVVFVGSKSNADCISNIDSYVKMQLYGLHRVAIGGPCHEPQPMALKVSARAKWNAWQRLGSMSPEVAMEQYITLLSRSIPGWMGDDASGGEEVLSDVGVSGNLTSNLHKQPDAENERKSEELKPCVEECGATGLRIRTP